ncbi:hypothetical protein LCGC14_2288370 [marine sediment metagenome]|uniref:Uncharacterized protein n=1 Tax=marine sediment metagenome TaxID=412755 RepID=A0A0F9CSG3_9ZZZZ
MNECYMTCPNEVRVTECEVADCPMKETTAWAWIEMRLAFRALFLEICKVLRIEKLAKWLNSRLSLLEGNDVH